MRRIGTWRTWRVVAGFLIAPLVPGALVLLFAIMAPVMRGESPELAYLGEPLVAGVIGATTFSFYAAEIVVGLPVFLWQRRRLKIVSTMAFGFTIGAIALPVVFFFGGLAGGMDIRLALHATVSDTIAIFWWFGPIGGLLIAIAFWLIARPDRADANPAAGGKR